MNLMETSAILWRQRELLSLLLFKLEVEQLVLAAGRTRWLGAATHEVELMLERVRDTELLRTLAVNDLALGLGLPPGPSLADLVDALEEPWSGVFADHRAGLLMISAEIDAVVRANHQLLTSGQRAVQEALLVVRGASGLYRANGSVVHGDRGARFVDEAV